MSNHVAGKSIVITGAGGGFGRLVSQKTAALGARLTCADIDAAAAEEAEDTDGEEESEEELPAELPETSAATPLAALLGAVAWTIVMAAIGWTGGHLFRTLVEDVERHEWTAAGLLAGTVLLIVTWRSRGWDWRDLFGLFRRL